MLLKIHRWTTYFFASIFGICFLSLLILVLLFLVGINDALDIIFIPFSLLEGYAFLYLLPAIILFLSIPMIILDRRPSAIITAISGVAFIAAGFIYYLLADSESAMTQLIGLGGSAASYALGMVLIILAAYIILDKGR